MSDAVSRVSVEIGGTEISFETGKMAKQASGAVVVRAGDTMVLSTATAGNLRDVDFLPLTVDVEERMYAAGKIPGSFFKREGRAGEKGTLTARMIDRPIRPLFPKGWRYETQLVSIPLSIDHVHPYDILAMNGASAALMVSDIPFPTPVGAVRIGKVDGNFVVNPDEEDLLENTELDLVVAGTEEAILMVEAGAQRDPRGRDPRRARHRPRRDQEALRGSSASWPRRPARPKIEVEAPAGRRGLLEDDPGLARRGARRGDPGRGQARAPGRDARRRGGGPRAARRRPDVRGLRRAPRGGPARLRQAREARSSASASRSRRSAPTAAPPTRSAPISIEVGVAPRTHGSALFTRGQTQALSRRRARHHARGDAARHARARDRRSATSTTTTSRPSRSGRPASCAAPSAATSATARSPSGRWCR